MLPLTREKVLKAVVVVLPIVTIAAIGGTVAHFEAVTMHHPLWLGLLHGLLIGICLFGVCRLLSSHEIGMMVGSVAALLLFFSLWPTFVRSYEKGKQEKARASMGAVLRH